MTSLESHFVEQCEFCALQYNYNICPRCGWNNYITFERQKQNLQDKMMRKTRVKKYIKDNKCIYCKIQVRAHESYSACPKCGWIAYRTPPGNQIYKPQTYHYNYSLKKTLIKYDINRELWIRIVHIFNYLKLIWQKQTSNNFISNSQCIKGILIKIDHQQEAEKIPNLRTKATLKRTQKNFYELFSQLN